MKAIDHRGDLNDYVLDARRTLSEVHLNTVCKIRQGEKTCRYIALVNKRFFCAKLTPMKEMLDKCVKNDTIVGKGDNCGGLGTNLKK